MLWNIIIGSLEVAPHKGNVQSSTNETSLRHQHQLQFWNSGCCQARHNKWLRQLWILLGGSNSLTCSILNFFENFTRLAWQAAHEHDIRLRHNSLIIEFSDNPELLSEGS
jgi:hypothetical protein